MTTLLLTPISAEAVGFSDSARMAMPSFVFMTMNRSAIISTTAVTRTITCVMVTVSPPRPPMFPFGIITGKGCCVAPKTSCAVYSSNNETPIAVIKTLSRGLSRNGRYARNSIKIPAAAQIIIANNKITSIATGHGIIAIIGPNNLCKYKPVNAPSINTSPWAKLMNRNTP